MKSGSKLPVVMTIAGSDSGGGAGIQTDLKTFTALKTFGTTAITCITAQNPCAVKGILPIAKNMVKLQIDTVCEGFHVVAAKTGMLFSVEIIRTVAKTLKARRIKHLVVDPVMISTSGAALLKESAVNALCKELLPMAEVITPNLDEAGKLYGKRLSSLDDMKEAARFLGKKYDVACVVKGGHLSQKTGRGKGKVVDVLYQSDKITEFWTDRVRAKTTHGTGCRFSSALTAYLANGISLPKAVGLSQRFVAGTLKEVSKCLT